MTKKTRNILLAVLCVVVLGVAIWLIAGGAKGPQPAATEAPVATEAPAEEAKTEDKAAEVKADIEKTAEDVKTDVEKTAEDVKAAAEEKAEEIKEDVKEEVKAVEEKAEEAKDAAGEKVEEAKDAAGEKVEEVKADVEEKAAEVKAAAEEKAEEIKEDVKEEVKAVEEKVEEAKDAAGEKADEVKAAAEEKVEEVKTAAEEKAEEIKEDVKEEVKAVEEKAEEAKTAAGEKVEEVKAAAEEKVEEVKTAVGEKVEEVKADVEGKVEEAKAAVEEKTEEVKAAVEEIKEDVKEEAKAVEEKTEEVKTAAGEKVEEIKEDVKEEAKAAEEKAEEGKADVEEKAAEVKAAAEEKAEEIKEDVKEEVKAVEEKAEEAKDAAGEKAEEVKAAAEEKAEEIKEDIKAAAEGAEVAAEDEAKKAPKPFTLNAKYTLNKQAVSMFGAMLAQGNESRLEKINSIVDFVNGLDYQLLFDGENAEGYVSLKGEALSSFAAKDQGETIKMWMDEFPNYAFIAKKGVSNIAPTFKLPENLDKEKLTESFMKPVMKMLSSIKYGEPETVNEEILGTTFTTKTPINMNLKEMALVGLNAVKEMLEDEQIASLIEQLKAKGIKIDITGIDEAIANVEKSKEEELPQVDAGVYTNENTDVIVRVIVTQDGKEVAHSIGGKLGDGGVSEYQMGDKMAFSMRASKEGVNMTVKAQGMDFGLTIVPEARENGAAAKATLTMSGMELMTAEFEKLDEATLKGLSVEAENVIDVTEFQDKEKAQELGKAMVEDMMKNYKPALKEKLEKVAPEMVEILFKVKELVKNNAGTIMQQLPAPAGN